ncbi:beta/gamma crystallin-related protein [Streptomyces lydicamycinicus]|uniref:beta/gamma crystallin-related protein n=1 Tax=Streptomyces lydicamycinicus TaxID=1546107 RepID=UPI002034AD18|nr:beta/gamma crystallin-related protein [Streptomyces lydicamycinicus]USA04991.1 beta/gamma crystallin-related protein [Streptomyces lydicamycinicus]
MRLRHLAAAGAAAAALTLTSVPPASADQPVAAAGPLKADRAKAKVFEDPKYHGKHTVFTRSVPNLPAHGFDRIGSAKNIGKRTVTFYQHINYSGAHFSLKPGESEPHFGNHPAMGPHSLHFR